MPQLLNRKKSWLLASFSAVLFLTLNTFQYLTYKYSLFVSASSINRSKNLRILVAKHRSINLNWSFGQVSTERYVVTN